MISTIMCLVIKMPDKLRLLSWSARDLTTPTQRRPPRRAELLSAELIQKGIYVRQNHSKRALAD
jgi:hypothetical protein